MAASTEPEPISTAIAVPDISAFASPAISMGILFGYQVYKFEMSNFL